MNKAVSFVELTGGTAIYRHMIDTSHTLCIRHMVHIVYMVYLEHSYHMLEGVMGMLDKDMFD